MPNYEWRVTSLKSMHEKGEGIYRLNHSLHVDAIDGSKIDSKQIQMRFEFNLYPL